MQVQPTGSPSTTTTPLPIHRLVHAPDIGLVDLGGTVTSTVSEETDGFSQGCRCPPGPGQRKQIAFYDDGVGSGGGKAFVLLGGVFGFGLKRNVLDLYSFVCRNYEPGDHIMALLSAAGPSRSDC